MTESMLTMFALLVAAHALADYPLQGEYLALGKNRHNPVAGVPWEQALAAHALIHGLLVGLITQSLFFGALETICHALIDDTKCANRISFRTDQALHIGCKALWVAMIAGGIHP